MTVQPQKNKKNLLLNLFKIGLVSLLILLLVVIGSGVYLVTWVSSDRVKTFENVEFLGGGSLSFDKFTVSNVWDYPELDLKVQNLRLWENKEASESLAFFEMEEGRIRLKADLLNSDTILLRQFSYDGGQLHLIRDSLGQNAFERMLSKRPKQKSKSKYKVIADPDLVVQASAVDLHLANPFKDKAYRIYVNKLKAFDLEIGKDQKALVDFDVFSKGITFRTSDGAFAENTRLTGLLNFQHVGEKATMEIPDLMAGETAIDFLAEVYPRGDSISSFSFNVPEANMEFIRPLLSADLQSKITDFDVEGPFAAKVNLERINKFGINAKVKVDIELRGNKAQVKQYSIKNTHLDAVFLNRIPSQQNNFTPETIGSTFTIDTVSGFGFGFDFVSTGGRIVSLKDGAVTIEAEVLGSGPAKSLSDLLKNDQYLFTDGKVEIHADFKGPLNQTTRLLDLSDCWIKLDDLSIYMVESDVEIPLKHLEIHKEGNMAKVDLKGEIGNNDHTFYINGTVNGVSHLIGGEKPEPVSTNVKLRASHLTWEDLSAYLGTKASDEMQEMPIGDSKYDAASLKTSLTGIQASFSPKLHVDIDTVGYYQIDLFDFNTGLHFTGVDTLVLERTNFLLDTAKVGFDGSICLGHEDQTAYEFSLNAKHVDVEELLPKINYLNSDLLRGLNTLPNDVDIEVNQYGLIHEQEGMLPNSSTGYIDLTSNKQQAFHARVEYEPDRPRDPGFNSTRVELEGHAVLFNEFFDTEDFLFQAGDFDFSMAYSGLVPSLEALIQNEEMKLDFKNGRVLFKSADLEIPISSLQLDLENDNADVELFLESEKLGQALSVIGVANNVSEVVLGSTGKHFNTKAVVASERIVWNDLNVLIGAFVGERDPSAELNLRKTTRAIMAKFCPDIHLRIDELQLNERLAFQDVVSGLRMDEDNRLFVDTTGFNYDNGSIKIVGSVDLENLELTPFDLNLNTFELNVASILEGFDHFGVPSLKETDILEGKVSLELDLVGDILGDGGRLVPETAKGAMSFSLFDLEVDGLKQIDDLAEKFRMTNRLDDLRFATLTNVVTIDSNRVHLPLMEIPTSAFRFFVAGDMEIGSAANFWVAVPLANVAKPDSLNALLPTGYAKHKYKVHVEFAQKDELETKLRWSRRRYYKSRQELGKWKADKRSWREDRKQARKSKKK